MKARASMTRPAWMLGAPAAVLVVVLAVLAVTPRGGHLPGPVAAAQAVSATPAPQPDTDEPDITQDEDHGGGRNIVTVLNRHDRRMRIRGNIQLARVPGATAAPVNYAGAYSSCTDCQTYAVALQIALIRKDASRITPQNAAVALNFACTRCITVARALQYVVQVDDPDEVPEDVQDLIKDMDRELRQIAKDRTQTIAEADARITAVIAQFRTLAQSLYEQRDEKDD